MPAGKHVAGADHCFSRAQRSRIPGFDLRRQTEDHARSVWRPGFGEKDSSHKRTAVCFNGWSGPPDLAEGGTARFLVSTGEPRCHRALAPSPSTTVSAAAQDELPEPVPSQEPVRLVRFLLRGLRTRPLLPVSQRSMSRYFHSASSLSASHRAVDTLGEYRAYRIPGGSAL